MSAADEGHIRAFHVCQECSQNMQNSGSFLLHQHKNKKVQYFTHCRHDCHNVTTLNRKYVYTVYDIKFVSQPIYQDELILDSLNKLVIK